MAATETSARANEVLDELYREHVGDVYRYTYAVLGNHADAEDVTQTTFVNALRALERGETPEEPSHWLTVIAHNLVRQRWRQAANRPALVELETDVAEAEEDEEEFELEELVRALQRIPETQREAIVMRELEGRSYREIATVMGLSTSALETLLFRARRSLAEELENVVTCENAELALSKRLDGRLSRKDRRRLDEHLADCPDCARLAAAQKRQRKAFKGLALLPLPIGLALFKGAPSAAAATSLPTIGLGTAGAGTSGTGAAGAAGGAAVGGSLAGGLAVKVAAVVVTATVAAGVGYKGVEAVRDAPDKAAPAKAEKAPVKKVAPAAAVATHSTLGDVGKPKARANRHGKPASSPGRAKHGMSPQPGLAKSQSAKIPGQPNSTHAASSSSAAHGTTHAPGQVSPKHPKKAAAAAGDSKAPKSGKETQVSSGGSTTPKTPVSGGSSGKPNGGAGGNQSSGATSAPAGGGAAPTGGTSTGTTTSPPATVSPSQTQQPAPPSTSTPPVSPPPITTPPVTTPPSTDPAPGDTTTPPSGSTGDTSGDTSGSEGDSSDTGNNGVDASEQGQKLGHHKGNHDGKHPEDS
ncbi:MAG TPA: sigma-70 family RNA polymerase sigma factor [Gaiella sp.]|nr:sigma-70 family RNA polymerase sigma factor [Gaiella sp.]